MITIGLTGGIACGKSTVAHLLREAGIPVIDADAVSRDITHPGSDALMEIVTAFGPEMLTPTGELNRAALRQRVVDDPEARQRLEGITHPRIAAHILQHLQELAQSGAPVAVVEAALMVETGSYRRYDKLLVVSCQPDTQLRRLMARSHLSLEEAQNWIDNQSPLSQKEALAHGIVFNEGDMAQLAHQLWSVWEALHLPLPPQGNSPANSALTR